MKKVIALLLILAMALSLTACGFPSIDDLCGIWSAELEQDTDTAQTLLENMDFYPEEIEVIDLDGLKFVEIVEFNADKTYRFAFDEDGTKQNIRQFYADAIDDLYENREQLTSLYGDEVSGMSAEEFEQFYAEMYEIADIDTLLDFFTENCLDYATFTEDYERGTFRLLLDSILCTVDGETVEEKLGFSIDGDSLTLVYADGEYVYTRR